jgi:jmjN domain
MTDFSAIPFAKVLRPTEEEFADFPRFIEKIEWDKSIQSHGLVKVLHILFFAKLAFFGKLLKRRSYLLSHSRQPIKPLRACSQE